jgi:hypothetical protein
MAVWSMSGSISLIDVRNGFWNKAAANEVPVMMARVTKMAARHGDPVFLSVLFVM